MPSTHTLYKGIWQTVQIQHRHKADGEIQNEMMSDKVYAVCLNDTTISVKW